MGPDKTEEMQTFAARLASFQQPHQLSKRRASAQKKKNTVEWPHENPSPEDLARAGFFYRPGPDSSDNAQCFLCAVKLDGWEPSDNPLQEHIAHSRTCAWAKCLSVSRGEDTDEAPETRDPLSDDMRDARIATFETGQGWAHEGKRGWKCKIDRMVDAGWSFDPSPETEDGVTCFYCNLSLDGWEPKDDPFEEHRRRSPECTFFVLVEQYAAGRPGAKTKGKPNGRVKGSAASKGSRLSTQSLASIAVSETPSMADMVDQSAQMDDSIMTTGTISSQTGAKGRKKTTRAKAAPKTAKGRKKAGTQDETGVQYPDISQAHAEPITSQPLVDEGDNIHVFTSPRLEMEEDLPSLPTKATRKGSRNSRQVDSSVVEISQIDAAPKKTTRGRKAKAPPAPEPEPELEMEMEHEIEEAPVTPDAEHRLSEVSAQLQEELENSVDIMEPDDEATPQAPTTKPKCGTKRTSEGMRKQQEDSIVVGVEFPVPPQPAPAAKGKKGRKPKTSVTPEESEVEMPPVPSAAVEVPNYDLTEDEEPVKPAKGKKAAAKKGKGKKTSSARSSKVTANAPEPRPEPEEEIEDLAADERAIELELERIAAEQRSQQEQQSIAAVRLEQEREEEYEPSPTHKQARTSAEDLQVLEDEVAAEGTPNWLVQEQSDAADSPRSPAPPSKAATPSPSPAASDKENLPSSAIPPSTIKPAYRPLQQSHPLLSPTKTTRVPLAPSTPNRLSPTKRHLSSSKPMGHLTSTNPWEPIDLDAALDTGALASLNAALAGTPGRLAGRLAEAANGGLTEVERGMSVQEWVKWRAEKGEEELRRRGEALVGVFEREGVRALGVLEGVVVAAA